jgi:hypothetical protein
MSRNVARAEGGAELNGYLPREDLQYLTIYENLSVYSDLLYGKNYHGQRTTPEERDEEKGSQEHEREKGCQTREEEKQVNSRAGRLL